MVFFGQACSISSSRFFNQNTQSSDQKNSSTENGNGTGYDGKLVFLDLQSGHTCEGKPAPKSVLIRDGTNWRLIKNSLQKCSESSNIITDVSYNPDSHYLTLAKDGITYGLSLLNSISLREFNVDSAADPNSPNVNPGHGVCANSIGQCSLRAAFDELNSVDLPAIINIPSGTYSITNLLQIKILSPVLLQGSSAKTTILKGGGDPLLSEGILAIYPVYTAGNTTKFWSPTTIIRELGFTNANNPTAQVSGGSAIDLKYGSALISRSEFIDNHGAYVVATSTTAIELIVENSIFYNNSSSTTLASSTTGTIKVVGSEFSNNKLAIYTSTTSNVLVQQSSIYNNQTGILISGCRHECLIENTTLFNNTQGIRVMSFVLGSDSDVTIRNSTIVGSATSLEYVKFDLGYIGAGRLFLQNSILSNAENTSVAKKNCVLNTKGNTGSNAAVKYFIAENSIVDDVSCGTKGLTITNPMLQPLALNDGQTHTMLPMFNSPVIDAGNNLTCSAIDQRGYPRPVDSLGSGAICDIGAVETP